MDGAGVLRQYFRIILPLCKPALAALATLEFTFIYNDFLWALILVSTGEQAADHDRAQQPPGRVLHGQQPARRGAL